MNLNNTIGKYLTESKLKNEKDAATKIIKSNKSAVYELNNKNIYVVVTPGTISIKYPSDMLNLTYQLSQQCDDKGYECTQTGLGKSKNIKFFIDKDN